MKYTWNRSLYNNILGKSEGRPRHRLKDIKLDFRESG
jgi:hypothetical protein